MKRAELKKTEIEKQQTSRPYLDPMESSRGGVGGLFETVLRRSKNLVHLVVILPLYAVACLVLGVAAAPGIALGEWLHGLCSGLPSVLYYVGTGFAIFSGYYTYGFSLLLVVPTVNFIFRFSPKAWRGPYYSLEVVRWYIHNGITYLARYTFLEFVTPTPFNLLFYRLMGMKIGRGTAINTTNISDPSLIELGDKVTIGGSVTLLAHYGQGGYLILAPVKIGNEVTIGLRATVMGGVTIEDGAKILPHSVVLPRTVIPAGETWGGVPAIKIKGSEKTS